MFEFPEELPILGEPSPGLEYRDESFVYGFLFDRFLRVAACKASQGFVLPGSHLAQGEEPEPAVARAFLQDLGWIVEPESLMGMVARYVEASAGSSPVRRLVAFVRVHLVDVATRIEEDGSSFAWLRVDEALQLLREREQAWGLQQAVFNLF